MADRPLPPLPIDEELTSRQPPALELPPKYTRALPPLHHSLSHPQSAPPSRLRFLPEDDGEQSSPLPEPPSTAPLPPAYTAFDETINSFRLEAPIVYTTSRTSAPRPRYQLSQEHSKSGKPWRLRIRRLLPTESRRLSVPSSTTTRSRFVDYDDDTTLYLIENVGALNPFRGQSVEIKGRRANTLRGYIQLREMGDKGKCEFWHMTKNAAKDSLRKENERRLQKYGYHADDEWNKKLLFSIMAKPREDKADWTNADGVIIATEWNDGLEIVKDVDQRLRDVLVTLWTARRWAGGTLKWATRDDLGLTRAATANT